MCECVCSLHDKQLNFAKYAPEISQHQPKCWAFVSACVFALELRAHAHAQFQLMNLCIALRVVVRLLKGGHTFIIVVHCSPLASSHASFFTMKFVAVCCCSSQKRLRPSLYVCLAQFFPFRIVFAHIWVFVRRLLATDCDKCHSIVIYFMTFLWSTSSHQPGWRPF